MCFRYADITRIRKVLSLDSAAKPRFVPVDATEANAVNISYRWATSIASSTLETATDITHRSELYHVCLGICGETDSKVAGTSVGCTVGASSVEALDSQHPLSPHVKNLMQSVADQWGISRSELDLISVNVSVDHHGQTQAPWEGPVFGFPTTRAVLVAVYSVGADALIHATDVVRVKDPRPGAINRPYPPHFQFGISRMLDLLPGALHSFPAFLLRSVPPHAGDMPQDAPKVLATCRGVTPAQAHVLQCVIMEALLSDNVF
eukprot:m.1217507 g.1217507  ORF g.1217507 m.1217507 type:complete len:262 (+) comp24617_c1_seq37:215-1000(+)